jgi:RNA polymerase sigma factor (sigma-70 family)
MTESDVMPDSNSLTNLYFKLKAGDEDAANRLFQECFLRLVMYAKSHLQGVSQKMADGEDVALSALNSFMKAAQMGRFPNFKDRDDLWKLLLRITKNKTIDLRRYEDRRKVSGESVLQSPDNERAGIQNIPNDISEEAFATLISEALEDNLKMLDEDLIRYAVAKLEGYTNQEIADHFGVALRTVERELHLIRRMWWDRR